MYPRPLGRLENTSDYSHLNSINISELFEDIYDHLEHEYPYGYDEDSYRYMVNTTTQLYVDNLLLILSFIGLTDFAYFHVIYSVIGTIGIVLNLICAGTILLSTKGKLRTQLKLLLSLAFCDLVIAGCFLAKGIISTDTMFSGLNYLVTGKLYRVRRILSAILRCVQWASILTMTAIAIDLLLRVKKPMHYRRLASRTRGNIALACIWVPAIVVFCNPLTIDRIARYFLFVINVASVLSFLALGLIYGFVLCTICKMPLSGNRENAHRALQRVAVTSFLILLSYVVCLMPGVWFYLFFSILGYETLDLLLLAFGLELAYVLNTIIDPIIYIARVPEVRKGLVSLAHCIRRRLQDTRTEVINRSSPTAE